MSTYHTPVMTSEVMSILKVGPGKRIIDATVGGGGYGIGIVRAGTDYLGIDRDSDAIYECLRNPDLKPLHPAHKVVFVHGNYKDIVRIATEQNFCNADGILFDLGVSSHQIDDPKRGFGFRFQDAVVDLRFDQNVGEPAYDVLNRAGSEELYEIFSLYGEEKHSRAIADRIVSARAVKKIRTFGDVRTIITGGRLTNSGDESVFARIFQAIRIAVNDELGTLRKGLSESLKVMKPGGRIVVLTYQSLEDRIVKLWFRSRNDIHILTKRPMTASISEMNINKRSRSAKMRAAETILL